ncbi:MAG: serine/threonine-protein kinase [Polyangiales bacterium]
MSATLLATRFETRKRCVARPGARRCLRTMSGSPILNMRSRTRPLVGPPRTLLSVAHPPRAPRRTFVNSHPHRAGHAVDAAPQLSTLGRYTAIASLGQGGMANIYLAVMSGPARFNKLLVIKALRDDLETSHEDMVAMFLDEARLAARLNHRNIVQTYEFGEIDGRYYMAMEYLEGQPLRAVQRRLGAEALPLDEELRILAETARGLHYAHELAGFDGEPLSVVHRDVSPHNVMLTYDGQVKLLDFGIAKTDNAEHLTKVGVIKGKIDYIAPEQVRGDKVDRRADVFSLGAMLWEAVTSERFGGGPKVQEFTKIHKRLTGGEPKLRELRPNVPEAIAKLVDDAIALDPTARLPTAAAFADRIESYLADLASPPSDKSLAALIAPRFEEDRAKMRRAIDRQIQLIAEAGGKAPRPSMVARSSEFGLTQSGFVDLSAPGTASNVEAAAYPSSAVREKPGAWSGRTRLGAGLTVIAVGVIAVLITRRDAPSPAGSTVPAAAIAVAAEVAKTLPSEAEGASARTGEATRDAPANAGTVLLTVTVTPADARVTLDGAPLPSVPFSGDFRRSSAVHHLEASADGHQTVSQLVVLDRDRALTIALKPTPLAPRFKPRRPAPGAAQPPVASTQNHDVQPPSPAASEELAPGVELKTRQKASRFDMNDPYAE